MKQHGYGEWIDAKEKVPSLNTPVLVVVSNKHFQVSSFDGSWKGLESKKVTHWTRLPSFPVRSQPEISLSLSKERQEELFNHLERKFDQEYADFCIQSLDADIDEYNLGDVYYDATFKDYREIQDASNDAYALADLCTTLDEQEHFKNCMTVHYMLQKLAKDTFNSLPPMKKKRGRPRKNYRREVLIKRIYAHYKRKERGNLIEGSHFEETVSLILSWVEPSPPTDTHSTIMRTLKSATELP